MRIFIFSITISKGEISSSKIKSLKYKEIKLEIEFGTTFDIKKLNIFIFANSNSYSDSWFKMVVTKEFS